MTIIVYTFFFAQWVKMKGDCLFCWYWWNWWPLLFQLSFFHWTQKRRFKQKWSSIPPISIKQTIAFHLNSLIKKESLSSNGYQFHQYLLFTLSFLLSELRWEMIVCFVDIGGIDDHYCLNFLFVCVINSININKTSNRLLS
jgi:hypothetical protein